MMDQLASALLLVRPDHFGYNPENADNTFSNPGQDPGIRPLAQAEFATVTETLQALGLKLLILDDPSGSPDAVFPNNWFSFHPDGRLFFYPMKAPSRRRELRHDLPERLREAGFAVSELHDLSPWADQGHFLEGTGSLVLDHSLRRAYAALSERTRPEALARWSALSGYQVISFTPVSLPGSIGGTGYPIYHSNVLLAIGARFALWCPEAVAEPAERERLGAALAEGRELIAISLAQVQGFAGNVLEVHSATGPCLLLSQSACDALTAAQRAALAALTRLQPIAIPTIERIGGGSLRCLLAELRD